MAKQERLWAPKPHRAVDWNPKAVQKCIDRAGYVLASPKIDGIRALIRVNEHYLSITSREGIRIRSLDDRLVDLYRELKALRLNVPNLVLDCELTVQGVDFDTASGLLRKHSALAVEYRPVINVFDYAFVDVMTGERSNSTTLQKRTTFLTEKFSGFWASFKHVTHYDVHSLGGIEVLYAECRKQGYEGLVVKDPELPYRNGKVSGWWKRKPEITEDGIVVDYVWGTEGKANAGLIVGFEVELESGTTVKATGLTREQMQEFTALAEADYLTGMVRPLLGRYCEVRAMERTKAGSLRHPSFVCWRDLESAPGVKL